MHTVAENTATIAINRTFVTIKLPELEYLMQNLTALANQLAWYKLAETDVFAYVRSAAGATGFVPSAEQSCLFVQYDLFLKR
jgi:hypothetical protein